MLSCAALILQLSNVSAQTENSGRTGPPEGTLPMFYYDAYNYRSATEAGKTRTDIYVEVPYEGIQFVKTGSSFNGGYSVTLSIYDEKKEKLITEKSFSESISLKDFAATTSAKNHYLSVRSFDLTPATYVIRCEVEDKDSRKNFIKEDRFTVRALSPNPSLSDIMLVTQVTAADGSQKLLPNISRNVAAQKDGLGLYFEAYSDKEYMANVEYIIADAKNKAIFRKTGVVELKPGANQVSYKLENPQMNMGEYELVVNINDDGGKPVTQVMKKFYSRWVGLPNSANDLDKAIDQMIYIAKDSEVDEIKDGKTQEEKLDRYTKYWKAKDPSPATEQNEVFEEYYRRIAYANDHFKHYMEGWKTDMGMIYVTLGPPSNVERHPFDYDSKPYEVWDYYDINKRFIFVDQTGFGDYRLISPVYGNWWKYRP